MSTNVEYQASLKIFTQNSQVANAKKAKFPEHCKYTSIGTTASWHASTMIRQWRSPHTHGYITQLVTYTDEITAIFLLQSLVSNTVWLNINQTKRKDVGIHVWFLTPASQLHHQYIGQPVSCIAAIFLPLFTTFIQDTKCKSVDISQKHTQKWLYDKPK